MFFKIFWRWIKLTRQSISRWIRMRFLTRNFVVDQSYFLNLAKWIKIYFFSRRMIWPIRKRFLSLWFHQCSISIHSKIPLSIKYWNCHWRAQHIKKELTNRGLSTENTKMSTTLVEFGKFLKNNTHKLWVISCLIRYIPIFRVSVQKNSNLFRDVWQP